MTSAQNIRIDLAYKGTHFRGFAENSGVRTIGGEIRSAIQQVLGEPIDIAVAGRTDAGVHASGQVISFQTTSARYDPDRLQNSINRICGPDIQVHEIRTVGADFDARFSASRRRYHYNVLNSPVADPLLSDIEWHIKEPLAVDEMNRAAQRFLGEHDFTSFCRRPKGQLEASLVRTIHRAEWHVQRQQRIQFEIAANAFCHQMVRSLVGFCVAVGTNKRLAQDVETVLNAKDRSAAAPIAPPHGLTLVHVTYPQDD